MLDYGNLVAPPSGHKGLCNNGVVYANNLTIREGASGTFNDAIWNGADASGGGAKLYLHNSIIQGGQTGTGYGIYSNVPNYVFDLGGNSITGVCGALGQSSAASIVTLVGTASTGGVADLQGNHVLAGFGTGGGTVPVVDTTNCSQVPCTTVGNNSSVTSQALPSMVSHAGNTNVVCMNWSANTSTPSVTDSAGNTYTQVGSTVNNAGATQSVAQFVGPITTGSASNVVTLHLSVAETFLTGSVREFQGTITAGTQATNTGSTGSAPSTANVTTVSAGGISACEGSNNNVVETAGAGFVIDSSGVRVNTGFATEFLPNATAGAKAVAFGTNATGGWAMSAFPMTPQATSLFTTDSGQTTDVTFTIAPTAGTPTASPTITDTFATPFNFGAFPPQAGCSLTQTGGNFGDISNSVASLLTATGVKWTFTGTPVTAHTYTFLRHCG